jgi:hypothetical protein
MHDVMVREVRLGACLCAMLTLASSSCHEYLDLLRAPRTRPRRLFLLHDLIDHLLALG